ncbi:HsdR family type I site-specific deoxyribonuclease [Fructilactobacillus vespulae]|uniref:type I restriction endonuclease subunit R n=1 Tax=Fructilactobacillus vespulae TaxID=1249630 RepID=UPI0039B670C2
MSLRKVQSEVSFENEFVETLTKNGWTHNTSLDRATPKELENHFREILNQNNRDQLNGVDITDNEMQEIMRQISGKTPTEINNFLTKGYVAELTIARDNPELGKVNLKVFWRDDIAGGRMRYEVIQQALRPGKTDDISDPDRRFDVTLLFNGLPLIQVEEKALDVNLKQASNQIIKYKSENKYDGLFATVQIFVALKETAVKYFANEKSANMFNEKFFFSWLDNKNKVVSGWEQFTEEFLRIPMAHNIISNYMVSDGEILKVLRPYQIHAVKAIRDSAMRHEDGYVWHATGSGKTLTAYKTATLIQRDPHNQVIFMSDRTELDNQSGKNFSNFAHNSDDTIFETRSTHELIDMLKKSKNGVITTTINKMKIAIERNNERHQEGKKGPLDKVIGNKRFIFIVDEAHRSQFGQMQRIIKQAFPNQNWYGFTGTPIFDFNKTPEDQTTESQFGKELHRYNIGNALNDHAILDFNAEYVTLVTAQNKDTEDLETESNLPDSVYEGTSEEAQQYRNKLVKWIYKNWTRKSEHRQFNALLATSNIDQALAFYKLFKEANKEKKNPIKIAVTYSINENGENNRMQRAGLIEAMKDYSLQYSNAENTWNIDNIDIYIDDVAKRTARNEGPYQVLKPEQEIDLTIVVNRLLTGFDAPRLNTLYMDKVMKYQGLIQAYARTNRLNSKDKTQGNVVVFRRPELMEARTKDAFEKYAGEGSFNRVFRKDFKQMQAQFKEQIDGLKAYVPTPENAEDLINGTEKEQIEFLGRFKSLSKTQHYISSYSEFDWNEQADDYNMSNDEYLYYQSAYQNVREKLKEDVPGDGPEKNDLKFDFDDVYITNMVIDRDYVLTIATKSMKEKNDKQARKEYEEIISKYRKAGKTVEADNIERFIESEKATGQIFDDKYDVITRYTTYIANLKNDAINDFADEWGIDKLLLKRLVSSYESTGEFTHEKEVKRTAKKSVAEANGHSFLNLLNYKGVIQNEWRKFISQDLKKFGDN